MLPMHPDLIIQHEKPSVPEIAIPAAMLNLPPAPRTLRTALKIPMKTWIARVAAVLLAILIITCMFNLRKGALPALLLTGVTLTLVNIGWLGPRRQRWLCVHGTAAPGVIAQVTRKADIRWFPYFELLIKFGRSEGDFQVVTIPVSHKFGESAKAGDPVTILHDASIKGLVAVYEVLDLEIEGVQLVQG